jgi:hypothetical protein
MELKNQWNGLIWFRLQWRTLESTVTNVKNGGYLE